MAKVAFLGLGVMGYPMAGHLARAGHEVTVYNRTSAKAKKWVTEYGHAMARTPKEASSDCSLVFMCVGNDNDVREVVLAKEGALAGMDDGAILVDHTTASFSVAQEIDQHCRTKGVGFIDAPVSGGQAGAENGQLAIMCGSSSVEEFSQGHDVMAAYAKACAHIGAVGHGQLTKMMNQIAIAGLVQSLSEAIAFGEKAGIDLPKALKVISNGAAGSWQMSNRWQTMMNDEFDFGFAVDWMRKDLGICLDTAKENGARLPITALVDQFYAEIQATGGNRWDTSSLVRLLRDK